MCDRTNNPGIGDGAWGAFEAAIFGFWFLFFAVGLVFGPRDPDTSIGTLIAMAAFTLWLGCMTIGGVGIAAKKAWADRFTNRLFGLGALAIQGIVVWDLSIAIVSGDGPRAAFYYAVIVWIGVSFAMYFGSRGTTPRPAYVDCAIWPVLLFLKAPAASILLFAIPAVLVVGGEWLGAKLQHPHLGAAVGFGSFLAVVVFVYYCSRSLTE